MLVRFVCNLLVVSTYTFLCSCGSAVMSSAYDAGLPEGDSGATDCGAACTDPPGPCYSATGVCEQGLCKYTRVQDGMLCDDADACTTGDVCHADGCAGVPMDCTTPPPHVCVDDVTMAWYPWGGTCDDGVCHYDATFVTCAHGCVGDACVMP